MLKLVNDPVEPTPSAEPCAAARRRAHERQTYYPKCLPNSLSRLIPAVPAVRNAPRTGADSRPLLLSQKSMRLEQAYPELSFRWRSRNWWARLARLPAECVHLERGGPWMATLIPDTLYLRGKASHRRRPVRPEVSLCLSCLQQQLEKELSRFSGRVIAFEPDGAEFTQYFFVGTPEFG